MAAIRGRDTKPELEMRRLLRAAGATGYRLHRKDLPGRPDVAFLRWRVAVFVDGSYWHGHPDVWPEGRVASEYWMGKIARNRWRDERATSDLEAVGWTVLRILDVDLRADPDGSVARVADALRRRGWQAQSA